MISIIADTHTHTLANDHAYSTLAENLEEAARKKLKFLCMTEHTPNLLGAPNLFHFTNLKEIPRKIKGVLILRGAEVNMIDYEGGLDLPDKVLGRLEWVIASLHQAVIEPADPAVHTEAWLNIAHNPLIDVVGHIGDSRYSCDYERVIREFAKTGKIVEINNHSFAVRPGSTQNCAQVARLCARHKVPVVVSSDAHHASQIGYFDTSLAMLEEIEFPQELILNADYRRFLAVAEEKAGVTLEETE